MKKIAILIFVAANVLCFSQTTKKKTHRKPAKKSYVKKNHVQKTVPINVTEIQKSEQNNEVKKELDSTVAVKPQEIEVKNEIPVIAEKNDYEISAEKLLKKKGWINNRNSFLIRGVEGFIKGVYSGNGKIYIMIEVANRSNINYDIENISFITSPIKKKGLDFDTEEKIFLPIWSNQPEFINKKTVQKMVFVFDKFTIGENKTLNAVFNEKEGERNLKLEIKPNYILGAEYVN